MRTNTPAKLRSKQVFDLSGEELAGRIRETSEAVIENAWSKGGYVTYYDDNVCPDVKHMIHECQDRKELMRIDRSFREIPLISIDMNPQLLIFGGPNGAGKSAFSKTLSAEGALFFDIECCYC